MKIWIYISLLAFFTSCNIANKHHVTRSIDLGKLSDKKDCQIYFSRKKVFEDSIKPLVRLTLADPGSTGKCSQEHAYKLLIKETCKINGNLVILSNEKFVDETSGCYRCVADIYELDQGLLYEKYNKDNSIKSDEIFVKGLKAKNTGKQTARLLISIGVASILFSIFVAVTSKIFM